MADGKRRGPGHSVMSQRNFKGQPCVSDVLLPSSPRRVRGSMRDIRASTIEWRVALGGWGAGGRCHGAALPRELP
eukprot:4572775-Pyramimonas_sp.AAC.1